MKAECILEVLCVWQLKSEYVCVKEKAGTGGHAEEIEAPICCHCHGYCHNDLAGGKPK